MPSFQKAVSVASRRMARGVPLHPFVLRAQQIQVERSNFAPRSWRCAKRLRQELAKA